MDRKQIKQVGKIEREVRHWCFFSQNLFKLYSDTILRELEDLLVFTIGDKKLKGRKHADAAVLMVVSEGKLERLLEKKVTKESKKKELRKQNVWSSAREAVKDVSFEWETSESRIYRYLTE